MNVPVDTDGDQWCNHNIMYVCIYIYISCMIFALHCIGLHGMALYCILFQMVFIVHVFFTYIYTYTILCDVGVCY